MLVYKTTFSKYVFRSRNLPFVMWTCCNHSERRRLFQGGKKGKYFLLVNKQLKNGCTVLSIWHDFLALRRIILSLKNRGLWGSFNSTAIYVLNAKNFQKIKATSILTVLLFFFSQWQPHLWQWKLSVSKCWRMAQPSHTIAHPSLSWWPLGNMSLKETTAQSQISNLPQYSSRNYRSYSKSNITPFNISR